MNQTEEIKNKIDIVGLISSYLTLKKAGKNYKACCPFHKEKTPSFMVSPEKQIWYCFGCNQGGDIFSFVEKMEGLDFVGALNLLAEKSGVILDNVDYAKKGEKDRYYEILELSAKFFSYILNEHKGGTSAKKYLLENRKLTEKTIKDFNIGFAPENQTLLKDFLLKKRFTEKEIEKVGLISANYQGKLNDKFRNRIIFPFRNLSGKVVGFGGRIFKEEKNPKFTPPKYLNSPQTDIYDKSSFLYGLYEAKDAIREKELAIIVEGQFDVISSHQAGVKNVVASSGTALTERHIEILSRYTDNIAFCFDTDEAGKTATKRAFEITRFTDMNIKAIVLPEGKDPDELVMKDPNEWIKCSSSPVPILGFYFDILMKANDLGSTPDSKKKIAKEFIPILKTINNDIEKAHWIQKISEDLKINEKYIIEALDKVKVDSREIAKEDRSQKIKISQETLLLAALVFYPQKIKEVLAKVEENDLAEDLGKSIYKVLNYWHNKGEKEEKIDLDYIKKNISSEKQKDLDLVFFLALGFFDGLSEAEILKDIDDLASAVLKNKKEKRKSEIEIELSSLDKTKEKEKIKTLLKELQSLI